MDIFQEESHYLTYAMVLAESDQSESDRDHARMGEESDSIKRVVQLRRAVLGKAGQHKLGQGAAVEQVADIDDHFERMGYGSGTVLFFLFW